MLVKIAEEDAWRVGFREIPREIAGIAGCPGNNKGGILRPGQYYLKYLKYKFEEYTWHCFPVVPRGTMMRFLKFKL